MLLILSHFPQLVSVLRFLPHHLVVVVNEESIQFLPVSVESNNGWDLDRHSSLDDDEELVAVITEAEDCLLLTELLKGQSAEAFQQGFSVAFLLEIGEELVALEKALHEFQVFLASFLAPLAQYLLYHLHKIKSSFRTTV